MMEALAMLNAQLITTIPVADETKDRPLGLAIDTINRIYVLVSTGEQTPGYVRVIDGTTKTDLRIDVQNDPRLAAVDTGLGRLYVTNRNSGTISVIDTAAPKSTPLSVPVAAALFGVAVDPVLHRVYVASAGTGAIVVLDDAPANPQRPQVIAQVPLGD